MIELLSMPAEQIDSSHIESFVDSKIPEGEHVEFKESLPTRDGKPDPWISGGKIGDRAKNTILGEVVAFANAYGGALLLGIKESRTKPAVADSVFPIPRCEDLAECLKMVFRDRVEPQLPMLEIFAVPIEGEDGGVVIIRVGRSRLAPHRVTKTLVCTVRRSDRCEEMTMREIQDMTLNMARGLERLDKRLSERHQRFQKEFECLQTPADALGIHFAAMPIVDEIRLDRVFHRGAIVEEFNEQWHKISIEQSDQEPYILKDMEIFRGIRCRPMLRATREESDWGPGNMDRTWNSYRELHCDGLIEIGFVSGVRHGYSQDELSLHQDFPITIFANLAVWADRIRKQASVPTAEYVIEGEICVIGTPAVVAADLNSPPIFSSATIMKPCLVKFPRYSLGDPEEISDLVALFYRDFWNSLGKDIDTGEFTFEIQGWRDD